MRALRLLQPRMLKAVGGGDAHVCVEMEHRDEEAGEVVGAPPAPLVLVDEHVCQRPRLQLRDVPQLTCVQTR